MADTKNFLDYNGLSIFWEKVKKVIEVNKTVTDDTISSLEGRVEYLEKSGLYYSMNMVNITYEELKNLRDDSLLVPGQQYRITDYVTTTTQSNTRIAEEYHQFDIIVTADYLNVLNENARAIQHEGDTYFSNSDLNAWELKYCLDNDTSRFAWADATNGKGVIYYMKDEWNNECPYDFKNIQFKRFAVTGCNVSSLNVYNEENYYAYYYGAINLYGNQTIQEATYGEDFVWVYTFALKDFLTETWHDYTILNSIGLKTDESSIITCHSNVIKEYRNEYLGEYGRKAIWLNNIVFFNCYSDISSPDYSDLFSYCYSNTFDNDCNSNSFSNNCHSNSFSNNCSSNSLGEYCYSNSFGNNCNDNKLDNSCYYNEFGNDCNSNSFGNNCHANIFGNSYNSNSFGNDCSSNSFGNDCFYNSFGNDCSSNSFGNDCFYNSFGNNCSSNSFGNDCYYNSFGNNCDYNSFRLSASKTATLLNYCFCNHFDDGCCYNVIWNSAQLTNSNKLQNINIVRGISGTSSAYNFINIVDKNAAYEIKVAKNSNGVIKIYCEVDLIK